MTWYSLEMLRIAAALLIVGSATTAGSQTVTRDPTARTVTVAMRTLPVRTVGRMVAHPLGGDMPAGATGWLHQWPGPYWEAAFRGDRVVLRFDDDWNGYRLLVDDRPPIAIDQPGRSDVTLSGLVAGPHHLRLERLTESAAIKRFDGFYVPRGEQPLAAPAAPMLQMEFIGPSGMVGYGDHATDATCTWQQAWHATDTQAAYPALVARHYGADYQVNAASGRGLIRNWGGATDGTLAAIYPYTFFDRTAPYADPTWQPRVIDLMLLADFVTPIEAGERWANMGQLTVDWAAALQSFVIELHRRAPAAAIIIEWLDEAGQTNPSARALLATTRLAVTSAATDAGVRRIVFVQQPRLPLALTGCDHHANIDDQRKLADWLIDVFDADPELLGKR